METTTRELFEKLLHAVKNPDQESLAMSMRNCHAPGMFSLVLIGNEPGKLIRVFIAEQQLDPFTVQLHTHRYPIRLTAICGNITHHVAEIPDVNEDYDVTMSEWNYKSFLNGGSGLDYIGERDCKLRDYQIPAGASTHMSVHEFHTVSCSKGAMWVVEELGFQTDDSRVLGVPFNIDFLYNEPAMFQINDRCQTVGRKLQEIVNDYKALD